jgi:hypothetical protein
VLFILFLYRKEVRALRLGRRTDVLLVILLVMALAIPLRPAYRIARTLGRLTPILPTGEVLASDNFRLRYSGEREEAQFVLQLLEQGLVDLQAWLPDQTPKPIVVRLHSSQESLQTALGAGDYAPTLGAYYLGKLELLGPQAWQPQLSLDEALVFYALQGPVVHELTHLLIDYQAVTAYPPWFSEGMAQYWEMRLRGYVWLEGGHDWRAQPHSLSQLSRDFSTLPEAIAYQESLSLVTFLYERLGDEGMEGLLQLLRQGKPFAAALQDVYGEPLSVLEIDWKAWLISN